MQHAREFEIPTARQLGYFSPTIWLCYANVYKPHEQSISKEIKNDNMT